jgi:hypothetical protein
MDSEAKNLFAVIAKNIDPHRVCSVLDVCSTTTAFENVSLQKYLIILIRWIVLV